MATLEEQLTALKAARNAGVRSVSYSDRTVTYMSGAEMDAAISRLESEISGGSATSGRSTFASPGRD